MQTGWQPAAAGACGPPSWSLPLTRDAQVSEELGLRLVLAVGNVMPVDPAKVRSAPGAGGAVSSAAAASAAAAAKADSVKAAATSTAIRIDCANCSKLGAEILRPLGYKLDEDVLSDCVVSWNGISKDHPDNGHGVGFEVSLDDCLWFVQEFHIPRLLPLTPVVLLCGGNHSFPFEAQFRGWRGHNLHLGWRGRGRRRRRRRRGHGDHGRSGRGKIGQDLSRCQG
jgi:hypothetical protein